MMQFWREIQISGDPDGPDPPDGVGAGVGGQGEMTSPLSPAWPVDHFYV